MGKEATQFKEGNPGKPKGAVNKTTKAVKEVFAEVFNQLQEDPEQEYHLTKWAKKNTTEFYKLSSKLIPIALGGDPDNPIGVSSLEGLNFEQLYQLKHGRKPD